MDMDMNMNHHTSLKTATHPGNAGNRPTYNWNLQTSNHGPETIARPGGYSILLRQESKDMNVPSMINEKDDSSGSSQDCSKLEETPRKRFFKFFNCCANTNVISSTNGSSGRSGSSTSVSLNVLERKSKILSYKRGIWLSKNSIISQYSRMQRLVVEIHACLDNLVRVPVSDEEVESWACLIYESMSAPSRTFHGVQHVFDISHEADDIQKLSAFFHDCIYYTIDGELSPEQSRILDGIIVEKDDIICLTENNLEPNMEMVTTIFGFEKGQKLNPFLGLNEFLSAALAVRCYVSVLDSTDLAKIATCIEATIPFRGKDENGLGPMNHLYNRLEKANEMHDLGMSRKTIVESVQRAADLGNRDASNFALADRAVFLSNTWNLLPESNISLRNNQVFRISDFTHALKKMTDFFNNLQPDDIYTSFQNVPDEKYVAELTKQATINVNTALKYMHCKKLSISVLAAFAVLTGGDAPVAMFLGDLPDPEYVSPSIEDFVTVKKKAEGVKLDVTVFQLLKNGRERESDFDIKKSPLAAFLYARIGDAGLKESLNYCIYPMDKLHANELLKSLPKYCVAEIGGACARIAITRSEALRDIVRKLNEK